MKPSMAVLAALPVVLGALGHAAHAQAPAIAPVSVGAAMPDFALPAYFVIEPSGVVQFKHFSQNTIDRPGADYLTKVVDWVNGPAGQAPKGK